MAMGGPYYHVRGEKGNRPKDCYPEYDSFDSGGPCKPCFAWAIKAWKELNYG